MDYFISDMHFGHKNVIRFCDRPFRTVSDMNKSMIDLWNSEVTDADKVFVLGDVFLCSPDEAKEYIQSLNGYKILVKGNHDHSEKVMRSVGFDEFHRSLEYKMPDGRLAILEHRPLPDCLITEKYDLMMHGHVHISERVRGKKINVSCDIWDFKPVSIEVLNDLEIGSARPDEFAEFLVDDDGILQINAKIPMEDYAGLTEKVFKHMSKKWPNRRKK